MQASAASYAQHISLNAEHASIKEIFNEIRKQTGYSFIFSSQSLKQSAPVRINVKNAPLQEVLDKCFAGQPLEYIINGKTIIVSEKQVAEEIVTSYQVIQITGKVTDDKGEPLPAVSVKLKGSSAGVTTDEEGRYTINVPDGNGTLVFSFIGFTSQEIPISGRTSIDVKLSEELKALNEVVVVGYGTVLKKNITTSVSKVTVDDIPKSGSSNVAQLMLGRASGLIANMVSAQPGGNVNISIRGAGSPIYVVDGVVVPGDSFEPGPGSTIALFNNVDRSGLAGLNPEDIESVEVLKDASASIYGIGAANGVILITTKKGKEGRLKVNYDGSQSLVSNYKYVDALNSQEYMNMVNAFNKEQYLYNFKLAPYGPSPYTSGWTPIFDNATIANAKTTDWLNMVLRNGSISNHNISLNGGSKTMTYLVSGNYFSQKGNVSNSNLERFALRSNVSAQLTPFIKLTSVINMNRNNYNNSSVGGTNRGGQGSGALSAALVYPPNMPVMDDGGKYSLFLNVPNPVALEKIPDHTSANGVFIKFDADFTIIKEMLTAKVLFGDNLENSRRTTFVPSDVYFDQTYQSRGNLAYIGRENKTIEATMSFNKKIGSFMDFDALIGVGKYPSKYDGINTAYTNQHDAIANDNLSAVNGTVSPASYRGEDERRSQFSRASLDILDRYVITSTIRRDGTDKFFPDKKYAFFPSISAAWKISNESFMKGFLWINLLKVRASYGKTGSDNLGTTLYGTYSPNSLTVMFNNNTVKYIPIVANGRDYPDVSWQKTSMRNIGLDFSLFKDRISGSFDVYQNDVTDMLGSDNTPGLSMFSYYPVNGGQIRRKGWDANLNTQNIRSRAFSWTSIFNFTRYNSLWMSRFANYDYKTYEIKGVAPTNARYYYETRGIINLDKSNMPASQPAAARYPGYPIIVDKNNDGTITTDDIKMDNAVPRIYFGLGNTFSYKNFDLDIFMYSQIGMRKYNFALGWASAGQLAKSEAQGNQNSYAFRLWNSQTNPNGQLPGIAYSMANVSLPGGGVGTDLNYQDASFLRARNITFAYNIRGSEIGAISKNISNLRIYIDAQNPFTLTKYEGFDPEIRTGGNAWGLDAEYPMTRTISFGVRITL